MPLAESASRFAKSSFDFLIVGGGTAGLVVAARLSEHADITVGVLEAGEAEFDTLAINVPGRYGEGLGTHNDWQYETTEQKGLNGRRLPWPRGKVLGGTSALNFMAWNRPHRADLDAWAELGNPGWGWDDML
jgi:choline dehydrogenase-like flavoprotein